MTEIISTKNGRTIINSSATQIERISMFGSFAKYAWGRQFVSLLQLLGCF